eukprot:TRINITY_DN65002_c0_g1_i1.p1 TRINITY_DN65002_c0_g1~~TRINITY_DN65002_c0_g1_i1.p1  ORF type:complete len:631 (+),score=233.98 TRINITY_DN65002_c0_g1_i1:264-1895(+)
MPTQSSECLAAESAEGAQVMAEAERMLAADYAHNPEYWSRLARVAAPEGEGEEDVLPRAFSSASSRGERSAAEDAAVTASLRARRPRHRKSPDSDDDVLAQLLRAELRSPDAQEHIQRRGAALAALGQGLRKAPSSQSSSATAIRPIRETVDLERLLGALDEYDSQLNKVIDEDTERLTGKIPALGSADQELAVLAYDHMMTRFEEEKYRGRYSWEGPQEPLHFGDPVPSYFANVQDSSIHRRKVLSMAGLRNLIRYGPELYHELERNLFRGGQHNYSGQTGLTKMRHFTGNVVDLDTTVLRASDRVTLDAINMMNKKQGERIWKNSREFSSSPQAESIAVTAATELCERFAQAFKLSEKQQKDRKIHPSQITSPLPRAGNHQDRGKWPLWHYVNAGQDSFHANVPTMSDVNGALLRAPFHCVRYYCLLHLLYDGAELEARMDAFFEDCVADTCFNQKWKSIEEFGARLAHEGTVVDVLQRVQQEHQHEFSKILDEDDEQGTREKQRMWELVQGKAGKDMEGRVRAITESDVRRWVDDPSVVI